MRTSLNEIRLIEQYLNNTLPAAQRIIVDAQMITSFSLRINLFLQRKIGQLVTIYHRRKLKEEAIAYHDRLFCNPDKALYTEKVMQLFNDSL